MNLLPAMRADGIHAMAHALLTGSSAGPSDGAGGRVDVLAVSALDAINLGHVEF